MAVTREQDRERDRDLAIELARRVAFTRRAEHGYLPQTSNDAAMWMPHDWVIDAIIDAYRTARIHNQEELAVRTGWVEL